MNLDQHGRRSLGRCRRLSQQYGRAAVILLLFLCFGNGVFLKAHAAPQPAPLALSSNRFLFVVETSAAMQSRAPGVLQMVVKLLASDLNGNLRRGDTLGVWTFNEELYAGRFPLQVWSADRRQIIAQRVTEFLRKQPLERKTNLGATLTQIFQVIKNSDNITVILFTDGAEKIQGTPFDDEINAVYKEQQRNMQKAAMPFVTVLRAQGGQIVTRSVNFAPWPVDIPIVPTPYEAAQIAAAQTPPTNPPPAASTATNAIALAVTEKKRAFAAESKDEKPSASAPVAPAKANEPTLVKTEQPVEPPPPVKPDVLPTAAVPKPVATPPIETPKKESAEPQPSPKPAAPDAAPTVAKSETPVSPNPQPEIKPVPAPTASSTVEATETQSTNLSASSSPPVQTAVAVPPQSFFSGKKLLFAAIALLVAAVFLVILLVRRARPQEKISLITRSMDRDKW
ncbi:MAG: VWA domain-containing protein [Verrucomicrobia bacterium]|nr:VWA domain-containing protein [Verrucomicrobiota bacterium]